MKIYTGLLFCAVMLVAAGCGTARITPVMYGTATVPAVTNENSSTTVLPFVVRNVSQDETYGYAA